MQSNSAWVPAPQKWGEAELSGAWVWDAVHELLGDVWDASPTRVIVHRGVRFRAHAVCLKPRSPVTVLVIAEDDTLPADRDIAKKFHLTRRELEVAKLLARRCSNKEIAAKLGLAQNTVWRHTDSVLAKLGVSTRRHVMDVLRRG